MHDIRNNQEYAGYGATIAAWFIAQREAVRQLTLQFTHIVCMIAYTFRAKGHNFLDSYQKGYTDLWAKIRTQDRDFRCTWAQISTVALHSIPPIVLDKFWSLSVKQSRCAASLQLRFKVPSA